jgi:predicted metal-dependent hydrolase
MATIRIKENKFIIGDLTIPYKLSSNNKSKYIKFVIDINGLKITKPNCVDFEEVELALTKKSEWVFKNYTKFQNLRTKNFQRYWKNGEIILFKGQKYTIQISKSTAKGVSINFTGKIFEVLVNNNFSDDEHEIVIEKAFKEWYRGTAREVITLKLEYYSKIIGVSYNVFRIKEQKTRWGSCSRKGNLNFNWRIIM